MPHRTKKALAAFASMILAGVVLSFVVRWSAPCAEERERARITWTEYRSHVDGTRAEVEAQAVLDSLDTDLDEALERAEGMLATPVPGDARGAEIYREAMERLVLAHGACSNEP